MCSAKQVDMKDIANLQENSSDGAFSDRGGVCNFIKNRRSCLQMFFKKGVLKNFALITGKHLCWSRFLIKL